MAFFFSEVELIYNVLLVSGVQQSDSVMHIIYIYMYNCIHIVFSRFFSIIVYYKILNIVPYAIP